MALNEVRWKQPLMQCRLLNSIAIRTLFFNQNLPNICFASVLKRKTHAPLTPHPWELVWYGSVNIYRPGRRRVIKMLILLYKEMRKNPSKLCIVFFDFVFVTQEHRVISFALLACVWIHFPSVFHFLIHENSLINLA